jgi:hypothetical protein
MEHYKVCLLGKNNNIIKTILFNGLDDTSKPKITNVIHSNQLIHLDDSIRVIKNKILKEFGLSTISYNEVYLFSKIPLQDSILDVYRFLTNQDTEPLTIDKFSNFLANIIDNVELFIKMTKKDFYTYDDLLTIFQGKSDIHIHIPIGQKFETKFDYSFSTNPYHLKNNNTNSVHNMFSFENSLLLNYGELYENTLYACLAEDIFEYGEEQKFNMNYVSQYYYPFLYKNEIHNIITLNQEKQKLIQETNANINDQTWKLYETVDMFYNIFDKRTTNLPYIKTGITSFKFIIHTDFKNILPLDTIFKNIHSTKQIPFIKYNPGFRMENIYRLYSEKTSTTGKKIPFLKSAEIFRLTRELGKSGQISLYIRDEFHGQTIELYMNFHKDGNIYIQSNLQNPLPLYDEQFEGKKLILEILLQNFLNPIIDNLNSSLYETGYQIKKMISLNDSNIEVDSIHYYYELTVSKKIDFNKYSGCITSIFTIENTDLTSEKGALFKFKRVENYQEMNPITLFIHNEYNKSREVEYVIHELMKQMELSEEDARENVVRFFGEHTILHGKLLENNGFPIYMKLLTAENILTIKVEDIKSVKYIDILTIYIDSILRIYQSPETSSPIEEIQSLCNKKVNYQNIDKSKIDMVIASNQDIIKNIAQPVMFSESYDDFFETEPPIDDSEIEIIVKKNIEKEDIGEDDDDILFGMDIDEDYDDINKGGAETDDIEFKVEGKSLKNPNPFQEKIEKLDPALILKNEQGKYNPYSKTCPPAALRQPIILSQDEKNNIDTNHPGSYSTAINYGSNPDKKYWYICPRYWSFKNNTSLTEQEVQEILKTNPKAIIPSKSKTVPKGSFIYEFNSPKEHMDEKGNYITHYPGLQRDKHPEFSLPCCFKKEQKIEEEPIKKIKRINNYVIGANSYPIPQNRWGFLPIQLQKFFKFNNNQCVSKENSALIQSNTPCILRFGVEQSENQSFIACFADIYAYDKDLKKPPTIVEMQKIIASVINIDLFIRYHNGSLFSIFRPETTNEALDQVHIKKYTSSNFYKQINNANIEELELFKEIILSYENFIKYIQDEKSYIDHTYMWDIITQPNPKLITNGLNLSIFQIMKNDTVELMCPTSAYSSTSFDSSKDTLILLKYDDYYEPIYLYELRNNKHHNAKLLNEKSKNQNVKDILKSISEISVNCKPMNSLPKLYRFKKNIYAKEVIEILKKHNYVIHSQVVNYQTKNVGFIVSVTEINDRFYVPCSPSTTIENYNHTFIDKVEDWNTLETTIKELTSLYSKTNGQIKCLPKVKVVDDNLVVGILTDSNQYVRISPSRENDSKLDETIDNSQLMTIKAMDYIEADKLITTNNHYDNKRKEVVRNIRLESKFYRIFRSTIRTLLNYYENRHIKLQLMEMLENVAFTYKQKLFKIEKLLKKLISDAIIFKEFKNESIDYLSNDEHFNNYIQCKKCETHDVCSTINDGNCQLNIPRNNLIMGMDNEVLYYGKISDELLRFSRVRSFILEPVYYLNLSNIDYKINKDEVLLLESIIKSENFSDLRIFNFNDYVKNITYDIAEPDKNISQNYSNKIMV